MGHGSYTNLLLRIFQRLEEQHSYDLHRMICSDYRKAKDKKYTITREVEKIIRDKLCVWGDKKVALLSPDRDWLGITGKLIEKSYINYIYIQYI